MAQFTIQRADGSKFNVERASVEEAEKDAFAEGGTVVFSGDAATHLSSQESPHPDVQAVTGGEDPIPPTPSEAPTIDPVVEDTTNDTAG